jgi:hypothetical protein
VERFSQVARAKTREQSPLEQRSPTERDGALLPTPHLAVVFLQNQRTMDSTPVHLPQGTMPSRTSSGKKTSCPVGEGSRVGVLVGINVGVTVTVMTGDGMCWVCRVHDPDMPGCRRGIGAHTGEGVRSANCRRLLQFQGGGPYLHGIVWVADIDDHVRRRRPPNLDMTLPIRVE